jgi:prevent-host-death family protein
MTTTAELSDFAKRFTEFIQKVESGTEVVLTRNNEPVARLVPSSKQKLTSAERFAIRSFKGHRVLTPAISQAELAEELFGQK